MDVRDVFRSLNSPLDWFAVLGAGTLALVLDGAFDIVPLPFFSPGICAVVAAAATLTVKRGVEAREQAQRRAAAKKFWSDQAIEVAERLKQQGDARAADDLMLEIGASSVGGDLSMLESAVRHARLKLKG